MEKKKILIIGGGYAGVETAKILAKKYKKQEKVEITLVDRHHYMTLMTELHEVAGGRVNEDSIRVSYDRIFSGKPVKVLRDEIVNVDCENKVAHGKDADYHYDYVVVATGGEPHFFGIPGIEEHAFTLWSFDDAYRIKHHIYEAFEEAKGLQDEKKRRELLTFIVVGAGFTGIEMIGELIDQKAKLCKEYNIDPDEVSLKVVEAIDTILPTLPVKLQKKAEKYLNKKGVELILGFPVVRAEEGALFHHDGTELRAHTIVWTCGVKACDLTTNWNLEEAARGRKKVNDFMQSSICDCIYIVGDISYYEEDGKCLPQVVETALQTAEVCAHNLIAEIEGTEKKKFKSNYHGFMVSIGSKYAVSNTMGMQMSGFFATALKHLVNLHYLLSLAGINAVWGYLQHEFFTNKSKRSLIGGHAAAKIPQYWAVPFRMFLGAMWLTEGIKKVIDGWLNPDNIYIIQTEATSAASDAAAGAEEWVPEVVPLLSEPFFLYTWIMDTFVVLAPFLFQASIVIAEIALGLAFIGGAFTFLAGAASIVLATMFILGSMADITIFWYIFGGILMLGGAGKAFGLDYWIMPFLKRWWNSTKFARRFYLYIGEPNLLPEIRKKKRK